MLTKTEIAIKNSVSLFHVHKVKSVTDGMGKTEKVIKKSTNVKLGKTVKSGIFKGMPIFTVTLEERATCSSTCDHWRTCYGNNMPFATRYSADSALIDAMEIELIELNRKHKNGFLVRLHILGDFYSVDYVNKWGEWLNQFENLYVYGYSERKSNTPIGKALDKLRKTHRQRFMVRVSGDFNRRTMTALSFDNPLALKQIARKQAFVCPVQENKTDSCGTCGLCWTAQKNVVFHTH
jgi:hypothetical protein